MLATVCDQVKDSTNYKSFVIFGGPSTKGTGGIHIFQYVRHPLLIILCQSHLQHRLWTVHHNRTDIPGILGSDVESAQRQIPPVVKLDIQYVQAADVAYFC